MKIDAPAGAGDNRFTLSVHLIAGLSLCLAVGLACEPCLAQSRDARRQADDAQRQYDERTRMLNEVQRLERLGRHDEAQALMRKLQESMGEDPAAQDLMRRFGVQIPDAADLSEYGRGMQEMADQFVPEPLFVRPLQLWSVSGSHGQLMMKMQPAARKLWQEGMGRMAAGDYAASEERLARARQIVRDGRGAASPDMVLVLEALGRLELARGRYPAALAHLQSAIGVVDKLEGPDSAWTAYLLWQQAMVHGAAGAPARALQACERALAIAARSGERSSSYAIAQNNLGVALHQLGELGRAREAYERSAAILREPQPARPTFGAPGIDPAAMMEMMRGRMGESSGGVQGGVQVQGGMDLQSLMQQFQPAEPAEAPQITQWNLAQVAANVGLIHWQLGDLAAAAEQFRSAYDARSEMEKVSDPYATEKGALAKAASLAVELHAVHTLDRRLAAAGGPGSSISLQALLERKGAVLERQARAMEEFRAGLSAPLPEQPGFFSGMTASGFARKIDREQKEREQGEDREVLAEYQAALAERSALAQRTPASREEQAEQRQRIAELDRRLSSMQQQIQMRAAQREAALAPSREEVGRMRRPEDFQRLQDDMQRRQDERRQREREGRAALLKNIQAKLPEGAVLLEMLKYRPLDARVNLPEEKRWGAARYGTFVIRRSGEPAYVDLGEAEPIERLVASFRAALSQQEGIARSLGRRLDALVMQPLRARFGEATLVLLAPEDMLNLVPFGALVDEQDRYLVERFTFSYLASGRDLLRPQAGLKPRGPALIIADPAFGLEAGGAAATQAPEGARSRSFAGLRFDRLPGTVAEAQRLKSILPDAKVLTGEQATETAAKQVAGPRILHIATHGFFLQDATPDPSGQAKRSLSIASAAAAEENPMLRSGLVFAGVNRLSSGVDDGVLTALEAAGLDLGGTKLVVLSACETGLGQVRNGEGVFGLRRAFTVAGAESLLMSLWQVADEATKDLMIGYYTRLARGEGRAEALRQTQLAMLKDAKQSHPFFWASFIPSGEWGSLK